MSSIQMAVYVTATGQLLKTVSGTPDLCEANIGPGEAGLLVESPVDEDREYVIDGERAPRPAMSGSIPATASTGDVIALPVPPAARLLVDGEEILMADDDGLEIEFATMGEFMVEVMLWPYQTLRQFVRVS